MTAVYSAPLSKKPNKPFRLEDIDLLIFDLDGTLVDSSRDIAEAVNYALGKVGLPQWKIDNVLSEIGYGTKSLIRRILGDQHVDLFQPTFDAFSEFYEEHLLDHTKLYPGVRETLEALDEKQFAVISNKRQYFCDPILVGLDVGHFFFKVLGGDSLPKAKPHPDPILHVAEAAGIPMERVVMIGDSPIDVEAGKAAGSFTIGLTSGFTPVREVLMSEPNLIFSSFNDLKKFLIE